MNRIISDEFIKNIIKLLPRFRAFGQDAIEDVKWPQAVSISQILTPEILHLKLGRHKD